MTARSTVPIQRADALWPVDRSVDRQRLTVDRSVDRTPTREWGAYSRSTARSTGPSGWPACTFCARRSTDSGSGRPSRSTDSGSGRPVGRPPEPGRQGSGSEKLVKKYSKNSYKSLKNPQKIVSNIIYDIQTCVKNFNTNIKHFEPFLCYGKITENQNLYFSKL